MRKPVEYGYYDFKLSLSSLSVLAILAQIKYKQGKYAIKLE